MTKKQVIEITACKADPMQGVPIPDGIVHITGNITTKTKTVPEISDVNKIFQEEAQAIWNVFFQTLPQGTRHQLCILMLQSYRNLYHGI